VRCVDVVRVTIDEEAESGYTSFVITMQVTPKISAGMSDFDGLARLSATFYGWHHVYAPYQNLKASTYPSRATCTGYNTATGAWINCPPIAFSNSSAVLTVMQHGYDRRHTKDG
jgi:hypothetical protein